MVYKISIAGLILYGILLLTAKFSENKTDYGWCSPKYSNTCL